MDEDSNPSPSPYDLAISECVDQLSHAISVAEGFYVPNSLPARCNNPGDLELGDRGCGVEAKKTRFKTINDGFTALRRECTMILIGSSHVYSPHDTISDVARKWTGGDNDGAWCRIVSENLKISPATTIAQWIQQVQSEQSQSKPQTGLSSGGGSDGAS
jgi:hypothetical protein